MDYNPFNKSAGSLKSVQEKTEAVSESFLIPEDIPQQERTAFHGAAAAAHKAGKSSFNFGGKKHPVTMKKDAANAIADQKEEVKYPHMMYDPKTGNEVTAKSPEDHAKYAKMGYTHEKPKMDEGIIDKAKQGIAKLKSMTPAAKAAARAADDERRLDNVSKHYVSNAIDASKSKKSKAEAKHGKSKAEAKHGGKESVI